jgi:hypothetical protein
VTSFFLHAGPQNAGAGAAPSGRSAGTISWMRCSSQCGVCPTSRSHVEPFCSSNVTCGSGCADGDDWVIKFANDCAADVLAISNADQLCGARFWDVFSPKNGSVPNTIQSCRCNLLDASDFEMVNKAFTEEGHKIWVSCRFRSGTQSQVRTSSRLGVLAENGKDQRCYSSWRFCKL